MALDRVPRNRFGAVAADQLAFQFVPTRALARMRAYSSVG